MVIDFYLRHAASRVPCHVMSCPARLSLSISRCVICDSVLARRLGREWFHPRPQSEPDHTTRGGTSSEAEERTVLSHCCPFVLFSLGVIPIGLYSHVARQLGPQERMVLVGQDGGFRVVSREPFPCKEAFKSRLTARLTSEEQFLFVKKSNSLDDTGFRVSNKSQIMLLIRI